MAAILKKESLGQFLVTRGWLDLAQVESARARSLEDEISFEEALIGLGLIGETKLMQAVSEWAGIRYEPLGAKQIHPTVLTMLPARLAHHFHAFPIGEEDGVLVVAVSDPQN